MVGKRALCAVLIFLAVQTFGRELLDMTQAKNGAVTADCRIKKKGDALKLEYGHKSKWPAIRFHRDKMEYPTDWSDFALLGITLSNPMDKPVDLAIRLDSAVDHKWGRSSDFTLQPGEKRRLLLPFSAASRVKRSLICGSTGLA